MLKGGIDKCTRSNDRVPSSSHNNNQKITIHHKKPIRRSAFAILVNGRFQPTINQLVQIMWLQLRSI